MDKSLIEYKIKTADHKEVELHLTQCDNDFIPLLSKRVNINDYSKKIADNAITFEAWKGDKLIGLIATYFNNAENQTAYITSVSVLKEQMGLGIASELLKKCIEFAKQKNYKKINLEVNIGNKPAISFYKKFNFIEIGTKEDSLIMQLQTK